MTGKTNASRSERLRQRRQNQKPRDAAARLDSVQPEEPVVKATQRRNRTRPEADSRPAYTPGSLLLPGKPRLQEKHAARPAGGKPGQRYATMTGAPTLTRGAFTRAAGGRRQVQDGGRAFDIAFSLGRADVRAPSISLPHFGSRWVSGGMTVLLAFLLYTMWTSPVFTVSAAEVRGNQRLAALEINAMLGMSGQPIFKAVPAQIEINLRTAYPDVSAARVHVGFPNHLVVDVVERLPLLAWYQNGALTWIDADGIAFLPRGDAQSLIQVTSSGAPPRVQMDPDTPLYEQVFIDPAMVEAMLALHPYVPAGIAMIYDPQYGMGWQDPRGWFVYFGQNTVDVPMKLVIYQSIVDTFIRQGIQPMLISVEHLDAPFYK